MTGFWLPKSSRICCSHFLLSCLGFPSWFSFWAALGCSCLACLDYRHISLLDLVLLLLLATAAALSPKFAFFMNVPFGLLLAHTSLSPKLVSFLDLLLGCCWLQLPPGLPSLSLSWFCLWVALGYLVSQACFLSWFPLQTTLGSATALPSD